MLREGTLTDMRIITYVISGLAFNRNFSHKMFPALKYFPTEIQDVIQYLHENREVDLTQALLVLGKESLWEYYQDMFIASEEAYFKGLQELINQRVLELGSRGELAPNEIREVLSGIFEVDEEKVVSLMDLPEDETEYVEFFKIKFARGSIHGIMGEPNAGKTLLAIEFAIDRALAGERVFYVNLETTPQKLKERILARYQIPPFDVEANIELSYDNRAYSDPLGYIVSIVKKRRPSVLIIDWLQMMIRGGDPQTVTAQVKYTVEELHALSKSYNLITLIVLQVDKQALKTGKLGFGSAKWGNEIEYQVDNLLVVKKYYDKKLKEYVDSMRVIDITKKRDLSSPNRVFLKFIRDRQMFQFLYAI